MDHHYPRREGLLYRPVHEHDACGVGFVADIRGRPSHDILAKAIEAVVRLTHRGAVSADGKSGDGAGVLTQVPHAFFQRALQSLGLPETPPGDLGVGMIFLPSQATGDRRQATDPVKTGLVAVDDSPSPVASPAERLHLSLQLLETAVRSTGLRFLGWRAVPVGQKALGEKALATCPEIRQLLVARPAQVSPEDFERRLYLCRRRAERAARREGLSDLYITSFSSRTIVYKGLMVAPQLTAFYPDLEDPRFETAIALFHQRYSTNTFPTWFLAQPFRFLGHNGEINTRQGNQNWMRAREPRLCSRIWGDQLSELLPVIQEGGSDSSDLDNVFELLVMSGRDPLHSMMLLVPEAYQNMPHMDQRLAAFYEYHATLCEPWDGPAALAFTDGRIVAASLDRNGLRPARYVVTEDGLVVMGSEVGLLPLDEHRIIEKGRLGPGRMLAVDTVEQRLLHNDEIKCECARRRPYGEWVQQHLVRPHLLDLNANGHVVPSPGQEFTQRQKAFGYGTEDLDRILEPMIYEAKEPVGSMGDDTPVAALSEKPRLLYTYFKQRFAQVTNPPIDPLREKLVMSLNTAVGARGSLLEECPECTRLIKFTSPILTGAELEWLCSQVDPAFRSETIPAVFPVAGGPEAMSEMLALVCARAEEAVRRGVSFLVLSDRDLSASHAPIPMLLAIAAVHHHLIRAGLRLQCSLIADTGEPREDHHFACLIGYGAGCVHPWLAYESVAAVAETDPLETGLTVRSALANYKKAVEGGLLKIMSKMGISTVSSYRGAQIFEALGLSRELIDRYFTGTDCQVTGVELSDIAVDVLRFHAEAYGEAPKLTERGIYRYRKGGEYHSFNPTVFTSLHKAVRGGDYEQAYKAYARLVEERPLTALRDLIQFRNVAEPVRLEEVETAGEIARRFCTPGMSHGALSREAHETLSIAMNRLNAQCNSGEGGEARERFYPYENGDWGNSNIKQIASARFGVTPEYAVAATQLEIKMAQGSKPGEGGQLPGHKVSEEIAAIRHSVPGVTLISPPPHHDIYSIEDLAQLIYDLKRVNPRAKVAVKLVSEAGIGTVAAGVAKGYADVIHISGHDGGTGASPLGSIKHAGIPWELGLAETQQVLVLNDLRGRVRLRADGGLKTGRDVVVAALLGAEEYAFGSAALVAAGCVMARQCHSNLCPVGVAAQKLELRAKFPGTPDHVVTFMLFVAEQVRELLAQLGLRTLDEAIGRVDLLELKPLERHGKSARLDLAPILADPDPSGARPRRQMQPRNDRPDDPLDDRIWEDAKSAVETGQPLTLHYDIANTDRTVGARLSGEIARRYRSEGLPDGTIELHFSGSAGQSFGAFCNRGMMLFLEGEAQDYVGKSMYGGEIIVVPPRGVVFASHENTIVGNTCLYGATGGSFYAAGCAGERFAVRNSGGHAVLEGVGDHGCEYMTGGVVVVLGSTGRNFGAGMSGGLAFVLDEEGEFDKRFNPAMVGIEHVSDELDLLLLRSVIERHLEMTGSRRSQEILDRWEHFLPLFIKVSPHPTEATAKPQDDRSVEQAALAAVTAEAHARERMRR
jgi:glutamate synthase domain-containing protein 2/glutamate synthase domain-containing protein 1/glutamate synthase domain-containing protein 3